MEFYMSYFCILFSITGLTAFNQSSAWQGPSIKNKKYTPNITTSMYITDEYVCNKLGDMLSRVHIGTLGKSMDWS